MNPGQMNKRITLYKKTYPNGEEQLNQLSPTWDKLEQSSDGWEQLEKFATVWAERKVKTKRRDSEQNEEKYEFIIRKRPDVESYIQIQSEGIWYDILTVEEEGRLYLLLTCEKSRIHSFYDTCEVKRIGWVTSESGEEKEALNTVYPSIPCELVRLQSDGTNETDQQNEILHNYILRMETKWNLKVGDTVDVQHKQDSYTFDVVSFFRNHLYQEVNVRIEGEA